LKLRGIQTPAPLVFGEFERLGRRRRFKLLGKQSPPILLHLLDVFGGHRLPRRGAISKYMPDSCGNRSF
jgi:hypothetical protein